MSGVSGGDEIDDAGLDLDEQGKWGEGFQDRALRHITGWMTKARDRLTALETDRDTAKTAIQDLRARVKALEDGTTPPPP